MKVFPSMDVQQGWKAELEALCAADTPTTNVASFDMTGDGKPERICWRVFKGEPNGEYLDLVVVHEGARRQSGYFVLAVSGGVQDGVCPSDAYSITAEDWTSAEKREFVGIPESWPKISLSVQNDCDPVHLFWPADAEILKDNEAQLYFARL